MTKLNAQFGLKLNAQFGLSDECDFEESKWTFQMDSDFKVTAGEFAIIPKEKYDNLINAITMIRNSMRVHPDCTTDSEFADMVSGCDNALEGLNG